MNRRPHPYHGCALPTELPRHLSQIACLYKKFIKKQSKKDDVSMILFFCVYDLCYGKNFLRSWRSVLGELVLVTEEADACDCSSVFSSFVEVKTDMRCSRNVLIVFPILVAGLVMTVGIIVVMGLLVGVEGVGDDAGAVAW